MSDLSSFTPFNKLLRAISNEDRERLRPDLEPIDLERDKDLEEPHEPILHAYFPESGIASSVSGDHGGG
jgi:hypothetical protein